jgi:hypothetical protein
VDDSISPTSVDICFISKCACHIELKRMLLLVAALFSTIGAGTLQVKDVFGRDVTARGVTLVEWGGQIANPAIYLSVSYPKNISYPADIYVHGDSPLIQFDKAERDDRYGVGRRIRLKDGVDSNTFRVSIFPSHGKPPQQTNLNIQLFDSARKEIARLSIPVAIRDLSRPAAGPRYPILVDFSQDRTGFLKSREVRRVIRQAADDWSYFLDDFGEDTTPAGEEVSQMWMPDGYKTDYRIRNRQAYRGYLLYFTGIDSQEWRSGGAPSPYGQFQTVDGQPTDLRRSGTVNVETTGNYNRMGWFLTRGDDDWWVSGNLRVEPNDLYTTMLHEIGHAIGFHPDYTRFGRAKRDGALSSPELLAYIGHPIKIDVTDHFPGLVDPVSGYGAFGNEYEGTAKTRRWLITKANLLGLQAIGYRIRHTAAFDSLQLKKDSIRWQWKQGEPPKAQIETSGGIPEYCFKVSKGELPPGTSIDSYSGRITGTPSTAGHYSATVTVEDNDPAKPIKQTDIEIDVAFHT